MQKLLIRLRTLYSIVKIGADRSRIAVTPPQHRNIAAVSRLIGYARVSTDDVACPDCLQRRH
jgi:hypothetical protein